MNKNEASQYSEIIHKLLKAEARIAELESEKVAPMSETQALRLAARDTLEQLAETLDALEREEPIAEDVYNATANAVDVLREYLTDTPQV